MPIADVGILIEIVGFFVFLVSAKKLPDEGIGIRTEEDDREAVKIARIWKWSYWTLPGHWGQLTRVLGIIGIIIGLVLQLSCEFYQYFGLCLN